MLKKAAYNILLTKFNASDTCGSVLKIQYNNETSGLEKKIDDSSKKITVLRDFLKEKL